MMSEERAPASEQSRSTGQGQAVNGSGPNPRKKGPVKVVNGWVMVDGCKVARAEPGEVLAFKDENRLRCRQRGSDQPSCTLQELVQAVREAEK